MRPEIPVASSPVAEEQEEFSTLSGPDDECSLLIFGIDASAATDSEYSSQWTGDDWELLRSADSSVSTSWSMATTTTVEMPRKSYKEALLAFQEEPLTIVVTTAAARMAHETSDTNENRKNATVISHGFNAASEGEDDPESMQNADIFEVNRHTQRPRSRNNHTLRRNVSAPDSSQLRKVAGPPLQRVMDKDHVPQTKTWACKLFEHRSGRQWLQRERRHQKHVERRHRKASLQQQCPEEHISLRSRYRKKAA